MVTVSDRRVVVAAIVLAVLACVGIVAYFATRPPSEDPLAALMRLRSEARSLAPSPVPPAPVVPPVASAPSVNPPTLEAPIGPPPAVPPPPAPKVAEIPKESPPLPIRVVLPPRRLQPEEFVFSPIPFDAPLAEFPLLLVWEKTREGYNIHELDRQALDRMKANFFRVPGAPGGGGGGGGGGEDIPPTEESPSGL